MTDTKHIQLWEALEKTDPAHTKSFSRVGGFKGTAINATYTVKRLTEAFGPCGKGWRFVLEDERIEEGHVLKSGDKARVHIVRGHITYFLDGQWYETSPQFGQTMLVDENKHGVFTDEEAPKKSITDCLGKCAVLLGVGADIHLGLFDDNKYVNERKAEVKQEKAKKAWRGPLPTMKLKAEMTALSKRMNQGTLGTTGDLSAVEEEYAAVIEQAKHDLPDWWEGYDEKRKELQATLMVAPANPQGPDPDDQSSYQE